MLGITIHTICPGKRSQQVHVLEMEEGNERSFIVSGMAFQGR